MISSAPLTERPTICDDFVSYLGESVIQASSAHSDLHSAQGALPGEHPCRSRNPVIKVVDIAWLAFEKPDLTRSEAFARAFGFHIAYSAPDEVRLRGTRTGSPCVIVRRGERTRFRSEERRV